MKKVALAVSIAMALMTGCASNSGESTSHEDLNAKGVEIYNQSTTDAYQTSAVKEIEIARSAINTAFLMGKPAYEGYYQEAMKHAGLKNFIAAANNAGSEEKIKELYDSLPAEDQKAIEDFYTGEKNKQVMEGLGQAALVGLKNIAEFQKLDTAGLLKQVDFSQMMAEKDKLAGCSLDLIIDSKINYILARHEVRPKLFPATFTLDQRPYLQKNFGSC